MRKVLELHGLERAGAKGRVVARADQHVVRLAAVAQLDGDLERAGAKGRVVACTSRSLAAQPLMAQLDLDDLPQLLPAQRVEDHDLVHPVQELRAEVLAQHLAHAALHLLVHRCHVQDVLAAQVAGHDHDRVLEIDGAPLAVGQPAVVQHLQSTLKTSGCAFSISSKSTTE
jgi:hypothetical protein